MVNDEISKCNIHFLAFSIAFVLLVFPRFASHELGFSLARAFSKIVFLYREVTDAPYISAQEYTRIETEKKDDQPDAISSDMELNLLLNRHHKISNLIVAHASKLRFELIQLRQLIYAASVEPNLREKFPDHKYYSVVQSLEIILSRLLAARLTFQKPWYIQPVIALLWISSVSFHHFINYIK